MGAPAVRGSEERKNDMKKIFFIMVSAMLLLALCSCGATPPPDGGHEPNGDGVMDPLDVEKISATIKVKDFGSIVLELYPKLAPETVCNFASLARSGFYDGKLLHRVVGGVLIQGGSSDGLGYAGADYKIKGEFQNNGFANPIKHERGTISMARVSGLNDSASSQFFILMQSAEWLDGEYAAFGRVTEGMDVVDEIGKVEVNDDDKPLYDVVIESVTIDGPMLREPNKLNG